MNELHSALTSVLDEVSNEQQATAALTLHQFNRRRRRSCMDQALKQSSMMQLVKFYTNYDGKIMYLVVMLCLNLDAIL